ncbi:hypothetical protein NDU88_008344 [Pleurodeles waltl]|uniref:Uncharacterized protein n=1 Tax=Pleurodeles waltl TaxID=8319 RepID=A0AAV7PSL7_PLEWA|nr:hypothetical protein NDU88_008344 [Pleurodeles waltl]
MCDPGAVLVVVAAAVEERHPLYGAAKTAAVAGCCRACKNVVSRTGAGDIYLYHAAEDTIGFSMGKHKRRTRCEPDLWQNGSHLENTKLKSDDRV